MSIRGMACRSRKNTEYSATVLRSRKSGRTVCCLFFYRRSLPHNFSKRGWYQAPVVVGCLCVAHKNRQRREIESHSVVALCLGNQ